MISPFIFIHAPISKPCEPPAGIASLAGVLRSNHIPCEVIDLNIESIYHILKNKPQEIKDTWTRRAFKNVDHHLNHLRALNIYQQPDSYIRAIKDINRALEASVLDQSIKISLSNYHDSQLSPTQSADLIKAMQAPENNPFYDFWAKRLHECLFQKNISGLGISINYLSQALCGFSVIGLVRKLRPDLHIWVGGGLISSWFTHSEIINTFDFPDIHFVSGQGEPYLLDFFHVKTKDHYALPDYDDVFQNQYLSPGFVLPFSTSRGCYWRKCAFCPECVEKSPYLPMPVERVKKYLHDLIQRYRPSLIHFLDNALTPKFLEAMIQDPPGVSWYGFSRITKHLTDPSFCQALKKSGCVMLKLGIESGDQTVLSQMKKGIDVALARKALQTVHQSKIGTYVYFLFGTPYETEKSCNKTLSFIAENNSYIDFLNLAIFNLPITSLEADHLKVYPFYDGDLSLYVNFDHPFGLNRSNIRQFIIKKVKSHPDILPIVQRNPIVFTSNHAPFFIEQF
ncbi:MAG: radical SAM protein [Candidatus Magnetomorum sp.]|nr:radical SAM protein [Candidatus Magnetomorum sp.]